MTDSNNTSDGKVNDSGDNESPKTVKPQDAEPVESTRGGFGFAQSGLPSLSRVTSVLALLGGIIVVGLLFYKVMVGFFVPLFMAAALVVIFRPLHQWYLNKFGNRPRMAAFATTMSIMLMVLLPICLVVSIAVGQLTGLVRRTDLNNLQRTLETTRERFGLVLPHSDQYHQLDEIATSLDHWDKPDLVKTEIAEAKQLIQYLDAEVSERSPDIPPAEGSAAANAVDQLAQLRKLVEQQAGLANINDEESLAEASNRIAVEEQFHSQSVTASAAINTWINDSLGGSIRAQAKMLTNPREKELAGALRSAREFIQPKFVQISGATGKIVTHTLFAMFIMIIAVFFFFVDGPSMLQTIMRLSPLEEEYERQLLLEFDKTSRAVVLASILSALAQGILATIGFIACGFESWVLLFMITTLMAPIPFLGAASVWVPAALYLAVVDQNYWAAALLAIYGAALVSQIDNVIKAVVLHGHSELHPLVALLSVLGGVPVFGPIGILVGPMVVVFLQTLLEILNHELASADQEAKSAAEPATGN
ncbi:MAG: hypothetical protein CBB71_01165 [Rhodopirellula sp. TMED11]|nr:MAG: hypothetical protein CBB71_01165 [Rhodopirellula sp. TMED11]